jgi:hypothetical protein
MEEGLVGRIATEASSGVVSILLIHTGKIYFRVRTINGVYHSAQLPNRASETIDEIQQT